MLLLITGMSGAGKTVALKSLEELGFFCVDNLPPVLLEKFAELIRQSAAAPNAAVVVDLRGGPFFDDLLSALETLDEREIGYLLVFLEARDDVLIARYKAARKPHPLAPDRPVGEGIARERAMLADVRRRADQVIDTSEMRPEDLRALLARRFAPAAGGVKMRLHLVSFGFKYGPPPDADLVFDVRFLPNPHYVPELRPKPGTDPDVAAYVLDRPETGQLMNRLIDFLEFVLPQYEREGKAELVVAVGCTGGRHRSVAVAEAIARHFADRWPTKIIHRDVDRGRRSGEDA
ncbi:RNase adapter RapZ [Hydrogenibacillus schlegelii]|uniref:GlmZ(SRNA)-inactivating NTPase n=2 Tax=Hydrogenibacillus schlegelii TaxID=1484 RepID=A0A132NA04_HYDSH|nr:RNase adapter RapZ [Hydrogenibacillus schlegelii]KWX06969.1 glmZ(sRNA)-inactivating NTPase [Hydrogenibacillus schlegelii]MBT9281231.1 RNase adapter RapZ [Hydrogenibacillus schlegelii]OAR03611.1 glmZ(sRNA)-inactivating NTPase [Hydrogenibacillus schlegelii]